MSDEIKRNGTEDGEPQQFEYLWRNKFLTMEAESLDEMIAYLQGAVDLLREMKDAGVALDDGAADDYAMLTTTDPAVAERFGFQPVEDEDDDTA